LRSATITRAACGAVATSTPTRSERTVHRAARDARAARRLETAPPALIIDGGTGRLNRYDLHPIERYPERARWVARYNRLVRVVEGVPIYARRSPVP
jgi:hypothetical protein